MLKRGLVSVMILVLVLVGTACAGEKKPEGPGEKRFEGNAVYFATGAASYTVECTKCSALVITRATCHDDKVNVMVEPTLSITHDDTATVGKSLTSESPAGRWVIGENGAVFFRAEKGGGANQICMASAEFEITMTSGGTITKLP